MDSFFVIKRKIIKKSRVIGFVAGATGGLLLFCLCQFYLDGKKKEIYGEEHVIYTGSAFVETDLKKIALTFDDGPHPQYTEQLLDGLKERGVVVTFFVTGEHAVLHPDIIMRMHEEGHMIGNHTYSHIQLSTGNREEFKEELIATSEVIEELIGEEVNYVRPPYGIWDKKLEQELNMIPVLWTVDTLDWCCSDVKRITGSVCKSVQENDIILMHDYYDTSVTAALEVVDTLLEKGYVFVTVDEILFD